VGTFALLTTGQVVLAPAANAAVPSCVSVTAWDDGSRTYVRVTNNCTSTQRFVIRWNDAFDSSCLTLARNTRLTRSKLWSDFQGLANSDRGGMACAVTKLDEAARLVREPVGTGRQLVGHRLTDTAQI
jgi:hypothetical protein